MAIELRTFASGDTDYIAKLNANVAALTAAINALQAQAGAAGAGTALSAGTFLSAVFNNADALIGPSSYFPTQAVTTAQIAPGGMYLAGAQNVVASYNPVTLNFIGQTVGTYFITVDGLGTPTLREIQDSGAAYSVYWNGSALVGVPVRIAPAFYDTSEAAGSRESTALDTQYPTLDHRLEAVETKAVEAFDAATVATGAVEDLEDLLAAATAVYTIRKVGCTVDGTTGVKGAIQVDFGGTIIGWSVIANAVGSIQVEVDRKASMIPPAAPAIPNTTTDKISASAPIALSSAQSAATSTAGVSTWTTAISQWDVLQFNVVSVDTLTRATLYLRIQEIPPGLHTAFIDSTSLALTPFLISIG